MGETNVKEILTIKSPVSARGQVVIPKAIREKLGTPGAINFVLFSTGTIEIRRSNE